MIFASRLGQLVVIAAMGVGSTPTLHAKTAAGAGASVTTTRTTAKAKAAATKAKSSKAKRAKRRLDPSAYLKAKNTRPDTSIPEDIRPGDGATHLGALSIDCVRETPTAEPDADTAPAGGDATPTEITPGETVERTSVPAGLDLVQAILKSAKERCKPKLPGVADKPEDTTKPDITFSVTRDPAADGSAETPQALRPTIGVSKRF